MPAWLDGLRSALSGGNPRVAAPPPRYPVVTQHGPTMDRLVNALPTPEREAIRGGRIRVADRSMLPPGHGGVVHPLSPVNMMMLNAELLEAPDELAATLAHESRHMSQRNEGGLPRVAFRALRDAVRPWSDRPYEQDASAFEQAQLAAPAFRAAMPPRRPRPRP